MYVEWWIVFPVVITWWSMKWALGSGPPGMPTWESLVFLVVVPAIVWSIYAWVF